jgi:neutral ceramidase
MRIGDRLLLCVPGEPSVEAGRRIRAQAQPAGPRDITDSLVVSLANGYHGYFTTPEEYDQQHYEGGHTVFGKYTTLLVERTHEELAAQLREAPGPVPTPAGERPAVSMPRSAPARPTPPSSSPHPPSSNGSSRWRSPGGVDRSARTGRSTARSSGSSGRRRGWRRVETDLGRGFVWHEQLGRYDARYEVPADLPLGRYRIVVTAARYTLEAGEFRVVEASTLRLRGIQLARRVRGVAELAFVAQTPPPDPDVHVRARAQRPTGGTVRFLARGTEHTARWDEDARALGRARARRRRGRARHRRRGWAHRRARQPFGRAAPAAGRPGRTAGLAPAPRPGRRRLTGPGRHRDLPALTVDVCTLERTGTVLGCTVRSTAAGAAGIRPG